MGPTVGAPDRGTNTMVCQAKLLSLPGLCTYTMHTGSEQTLLGITMAEGRLLVV